tara:strand:- start:157 stop:393 length:237 start_codon:yes stop_codon:yes gene_type:complete
MSPINAYNVERSPRKDANSTDSSLETSFRMPKASGIDTRTRSKPIASMAIPMLDEQDEPVICVWDVVAKNKAFETYAF